MECAVLAVGLLTIMGIVAYAGFRLVGVRSPGAAPMPSGGISAITFLLAGLMLLLLCPFLYVWWIIFMP
jgi:hypothetical protein